MKLFLPILFDNEEYKKNSEQKNENNRVGKVIENKVILHFEKPEFVEGRIKYVS